MKYIFRGRARNFGKVARAPNDMRVCKVCGNGHLPLFDVRNPVRRCYWLIVITWAEKYNICARDSRCSNRLLLSTLSVDCYLADGAV